MCHIHIVAGGAEGLLSQEARCRGRRDTEGDVGERPLSMNEKAKRWVGFQSRQEDKLPAKAGQRNDRRGLGRLVNTPAAVRTARECCNGYAWSMPKQIDALGPWGMYLRGTNYIRLQSRPGEGCVCRPGIRRVGGMATRVPIHSFPEHHQPRGTHHRTPPLRHASSDADEPGAYPFFTAAAAASDATHFSPDTVSASPDRRRPPPPPRG